MNVWATCLCFLKAFENRKESSKNRPGPCRVRFCWLLWHTAAFHNTHEQTQRFLKNKSINRQDRWTHIQHEHNRRRRSTGECTSCAEKIWFSFFIFIFFNVYGCARSQFLCLVLQARVLSFCFFLNLIYSMCVAAVILQTNSLRQECPNIVFCPVLLRCKIVQGFQLPLIH